MLLGIHYPSRAKAQQQQQDGADGATAGATGATAGATTTPDPEAAARNFDELDGASRWGGGGWGVGGGKVRRRARWWEGRLVRGRGMKGGQAGRGRRGGRWAQMRGRGRSGGACKQAEGRGGQGWETWVPRPYPPSTSLAFSPHVHTPHHPHCSHLQIQGAVPRPGRQGGEAQDERADQVSGLCGEGE